MHRGRDISKQCKPGNLRPAPFSITPSVVARVIALTDRPAPPAPRVVQVPILPVKLVDRPRRSEDPRLAKANDDSGPEVAREEQAEAIERQDAADLPIVPVAQAVLAKPEKPVRRAKRAAPAKSKSVQLQAGPIPAPEPVATRAEPVEPAASEIDRVAAIAQVNRRPPVRTERARRMQEKRLAKERALEQRRRTIAEIAERLKARQLEAGQ